MAGCGADAARTNAPDGRAISALRQRQQAIRSHRDPGAVLLVADGCQGGAIESVVDFAAPVTARWLDPTNGSYTNIGAFSNSGTQNFSPSGKNAGGDPDWVLVLTA
jgi:hypothetical protein